MENQLKYVASLFPLFINTAYSSCDEKHKVKMPYIQYHKYIENPWQQEFKNKLLNICIHNYANKDIQQNFKDYCLKHDEEVQQLKSIAGVMDKMRFEKTNVERQFEQVTALINATITNKELLEELLEREEFWSVITDSLDIFTGIAISKGSRQNQVEMLQEQFAYLMARIGYHDRFQQYPQIIEIMKLYAQDPNICLRQIYAKKFLYSLKTKTLRSIDTHNILPLTDNYYDENSDSKYDLVFIQGQDSHPLRTWWTQKVKQHTDGKLWPIEYLKNHPELKEGNPRIFFVSYVSKRLEREHFLFNLPDHDFDSIADSISQQLVNSGIGTTRPFIFISYSIGGVLTRHMIIRKPSNFQNLQGVAFIASPLHGSTMRHQINEDLKHIIPAFHRVMSPLENIAINSKEFNLHFMESGFSLSKMTLHVDNKIDFKDHNDRFLKLKIPYICLVESEKTHFPIIGQKYFFVPKECAILDPDNVSTGIIIEGKSHGNVQQAKDEEDQTFKVISKFIIENVNRK